MAIEMNEERIHAIHREYSERVWENRAALTPAQKWLLYLHDGREEPDPQEVQALIQALRDGVKPADYVRDSLPWYQRLIPQACMPALLDAASRLMELPCQMGYERRGFRSGSAVAYQERLREILWEFWQDGATAFPLMMLLEGRCDRELLLQFSRSLSFRVAFALDQRDAQAEALVREILQGDGSRDLIRPVLRGVLMSRREDLYQLVGQLLVAARLQEGLRQTICEMADEGQLAALLHIVDVIAENDLIRFSGVKRAVGCWLGLVTEETRDLERVSGKSLQLVARCLRDAAFVTECLHGEDAMAIYIALWALGVRDLNAAVQVVLRLAKDGSRHQRLTAGLFLRNLQMTELHERVAVRVSLENPEELDTQAVYLPLMSYHMREHLRNRVKHPAALETDPAMARRFCEHLLALRKAIGKGVSVSPCVFPWYTAELTRADLAVCALAAARVAGDDMLDACTSLIPECDTYFRAVALRACYGEPRTDGQRTLVLRSLCDKNADTRREALKIVEGWTLTGADYAIITDLMRFKYGDVRPAMAKLLMRQEDDALFATVQTLLADRNEERRMAGLSIVRLLTEAEERSTLAQRCAELAGALAEDSDKAQMVLSGIGRQTAALYGPEDLVLPELPVTPALLDAVRCFARYFPDGTLAAEMGVDAEKPEPSALAETDADIAALAALYRENLLTPVPERNGELLNSLNLATLTQGELPLCALWEGWFRDYLHNDPVRMLRMMVRLSDHVRAFVRPGEPIRRVVERALGTGWSESTEKMQVFRGTPDADSRWVSYGAFTLNTILERLAKPLLPARDLMQINLALVCWIALHVEEERLCAVTEGRFRDIGYLMACPQISTLTTGASASTGETLRLETAARWIITVKGRASNSKLLADESLSRYADPNYHRRGHLPPSVLLRAVCEGHVSVRSLYGWLTEVTHPEDTRMLLGLSDFWRSRGRENANRRHRWRGLSEQKRLAEAFLGHAYEESAEDQALLQWVDELAQPLLEVILDAEAHRGDAVTVYTPLVRSVSRLEGAETFTMLLTALGGDKIVRDEGLRVTQRVECLSYLLSTCVPLATDTPEGLRALIRARNLPQARMIEAALFCPEWLTLLEAALDLPGLTCAAWYFIAHMKDDSDPVRQAIIARYTPLTAEELSAGAFDIAWFRRAYAEVGETAFDQLYAAAKYISTGSRHARARRYADAALGRVTLEALAEHIGEKRNQDSLMAYPLVPLRDDADLRARYLFIQDFLRGSRKFGAQRIASEKAAADVAMTNLAANAGYADAMRLKLRMEASLIDDLRPLMERTAVGDVDVALVIDEEGKADIRIEKAGKPLKSLPAKMKKAPHILRLTDAKKQLLAQHNRARAMLETAMEDETVFTAGELSPLMASEVLAPLLRAVVFLRGDVSGLFDGHQLTRADGSMLPLEAGDELVIAHPYHLWQRRQWLAWQERLFKLQMVQPFRQVFRELYVLTADEKQADVSYRYAGHQIQPGKAAACLKTRRWVADPENGLQRVDYRRNIVSVMLAQGDWFTPADIEAPTLEAVLFFDRLTNRRLPLGDVPPVLFSEIMRDMDLAVSVAHMGGVDPEASHSTMQMRAALLNLTLPRFRLGNVEIRERHAVITGQLATYTVHLGSGVVHQVGGTMLNILPVHSAHRGRIFLPFADNDPQTAEVLSKVLLLAEDGKIKDPTILEQIGKNG